MASGAISWKSRDDFKKQKELEEARKSGTAPPEKDEDGKDINPHIPQYISQAPWYLNNSKPGLKHQRSHIQHPDYDKTWYTRGATKGAAASKYRKGACANCGAMTHDAKSCLDRPRKIGAKWTGKDIRPDEVIQDLVLDFDGKRDRWNGYDPSTYNKVITEYEKAELERQKKKSEAALAKAEAAMHAAAGEAVNGEIKKEQTNGGESDSSDSDVDSDFEEKEDEDKGIENIAVGQKFDAKTRTTVRNLRIREDTAKYLRNLDASSAYYDPKSRSMRENPNPSENPDEQTYHGDNWIRAQGDTQKFMGIQNYAFEAYERGQDLHLQGAPSQAELLYQQFKEKKEALKTRQKQTILAKYGGEEHMQQPEKELRPVQTEAYVEFSRDGKIIKGQDLVQAAKSKYEEDVYINNHTSVWGSYWEAGQWGYECCRQFLKNSYCTGAAGKNAKEQVAKNIMSPPSAPPVKKNAEAEKLGDKASSAINSKVVPKQPWSLQEEEELNEKKLKKAMKKEEQSRKRSVEKDERKMKYNSLSGDTYNVTPEEMEAYRMKKLKTEDPMAKFLEKQDD